MDRNSGRNKPSIKVTDRRKYDDPEVRGALTRLDVSSEPLAAPNAKMGPILRSNLEKNSFNKFFIIPEGAPSWAMGKH
jgi:hypothetical protein